MSFATTPACARRRVHDLPPRTTTTGQVGLIFLALALNGAVLLLMDVVLGRTAAFAATAVTTALFAGLWFVLLGAVRRG